MWRALFVLVLLFPAVGLAAERIPSIDVRIGVYDNALIEVSERIVYDFDDKEKHGIFRVIPYSYQASSTTYTAPISDVVVVDGMGTPVPFGEDRQNGQLTLKIGDPDRTVSGQHTYIISYTVKGPFLFNSEQDEFYWNVTGAWPVPVDRASVILDLPVGAQVLAAACFQGAAGSRTNCGTSEQLVHAERAGYEATANDLAPREGLSVVVAFPKGVIMQPRSQEEQVAPFQPMQYWPLGIPVVLLFSFMYLWYTRGRDPAGRGTIVPHYEPPSGVTPALAGILYNERIEPRELSAEIVRLAVDGYVRIHHIDRKVLFFTQGDYLLERTKSAPPQDSFQRLLLEKLSKPEYAGEGVVAGKNIEGTLLSKMRDTFLSDRDELVGELYRIVHEDGYFVERPDTVRRTYGAIGAVVTGLSVGALFMFNLTGMFSVLAFSGILCGLMIVIVGLVMPVRTARGVSAREHVLGFKHYLEVAEKDRIAFHNAPERSPELFDRYLPYAMAFGVETAWAEQFNTIYTKEPAWHTGTSGGFNAVAFAHSVQSFATDFSAAAMPSSPGHSGGGHVGGGFGGGGGGSW